MRCISPGAFLLLFFVSINHWSMVLPSTWSSDKHSSPNEWSWSEPRSKQFTMSFTSLARLFGGILLHCTSGQEQRISLCTREIEQSRAERTCSPKHVFSPGDAVVGILLGLSCLRRIEHLMCVLVFKRDVAVELGTS